MPPKKKKGVKLQNKNLNLWQTGNEVETLLQCVKSCKTRKTYDARINWNSMKEKYNNIKAVTPIPSTK